MFLYYAINKHIAIIFKLVCYFSYNCTAFIDYDARTVFGSPWEMFLEATYLIVSKGGSVSGYSGFFTIIPELQLSTYVVMCKCAHLLLTTFSQ